MICRQSIINKRMNNKMNNKKNNIVLEAKNIYKDFPGVHALTDVNIDLKQGEVHAVIGENGAGKSTLMNIIFGLIRADKGEVFRNKIKVDINSPIIAQELGIGIVPQELNLVPLFSVKENIFLGMAPSKMNRLVIDWKTMTKKTKDILAQIGEDIDPQKILYKLTTAQKQLVQIARALAFGAEILIFDEPTASLTLKEAKELFDKIERFKSQGGSVFYISHNLEEILKISDRVTVLRDGKKIKTLNTKELNKQEMIMYMVGSKIEEVTKQVSYNYKDKAVVLKVENLSRKNEFHNISFELYNEEILGIAGLVGAGRTELVRCIFGDARPDSGFIYINSNNIYLKSPGDAIRNKIAYLPEERRSMGIFPQLSVKENMSMPILNKLIQLFFINRKKEEEYIQEYINKLNIKTPNLNQLIKNLSGGNQQKAILGRWLLTKCKILLLDEPTRGIDVKAKAEIHNLLKILTKQGVSIIYISSELQEVINISDRILVLHEGKFKGEIKSSCANQRKILEIALS